MKTKRFKLKDFCGNVFIIYAKYELEAKQFARKKTTSNIIYIVRQ